MLQRNRNDVPKNDSLAAPKVSKDVAALEKVLTDRAMEILRGLRTLLRTETRRQVEIDRLYPLVSRRAAYDTTGRFEMPFGMYRPGHHHHVSSAKGILLFMMTELVTKYHWAMKDHHLLPFGEIAARLEIFVERGLTDLKIAPVDQYPGFYLTYPDEWAVEKKRRDDRTAEIMRNRERLRGNQ
jgi:hypothetical protein